MRRQDETLALYNAIKTKLEAAREDNTPLTSIDLFDDPSIRKITKDANKVSDKLGQLWRAGFLDKFPAPKSINHQAKFAYVWKGDPAKKKAAPAPAPRVRAETPAPAAPSTRHVVLDRPNMVITEDGKTLTITLAQLVIEIRGR